MQELQLLFICCSNCVVRVCVCVCSKHLEMCIHTYTCVHGANVYTNQRSMSRFFLNPSQLHFDSASLNLKVNDLDRLADQ